MELRRAADALIRTQGAPLSSVLNPRNTIRWSAKAKLEYNHRSARPTQRFLSTSTRRHAIKNIPTTTSASPRPSNPVSSNDKSPSTPSDSSTPSKSTSTMDDLNATLSAGLGWPSRGNKRDLPHATGQFERNLNGGNSASDLLRGLAQRRRGGTGIQLDKMLDPPHEGSDPSTKSFMIDTFEQAVIPKTKRLPMQLGPTYGRSVNLGPGIDPARGFRMLEQACARNKVKKDQNMQRFHERPGLKRKRLGSERWRRKFKAGFKATITKVMALRRQGW